MNGRTNGRTDERPNEWTDGRTNGRTERRTNGRTNGRITNVGESGRTKYSSFNKRTYKWMLIERTKRGYIVDLDSGQSQSKSLSAVKRRFYKTKTFAQIEKAVKWASGKTTTNSFVVLG